MSEIKTAIKTLEGHPLEDTGARTLISELSENVVTSINGQQGEVVLDASDVHALPEDTVIPDAYTLPTASATVKGGVKVGSGLQMNGDVLRVKQEKYVLIETISTEEEMAIIRTEEPDGTPYNFASVALRIKKAENVILQSSIGMTAHIGASKMQPLWTPSTNNTAEQWCYCEVRQYKGLWERERASEWSEYNYTATPMYVKIPSFDAPVVDGENIVKISGAAIPAGLTVEIYGVRQG